jgi:hypothetical protein
LFARSFSAAQLENLFKGQAANDVEFAGLTGRKQNDYEEVHVDNRHCIGQQ